MWGGGGGGGDAWEGLGDMTRLSARGLREYDLPLQKLSEDWPLNKVNETTVFE